MYKKLIVMCLLIALAFPLPCSASFIEDVKQFEQKYSDLYQTVDPTIATKMESFLQDVVDTIVDNYDQDISLNDQINYVVTIILTEDPKYENDLLPFLLDQMQNIELYGAQISEMKDIVRREIESRLNQKESNTGDHTTPENSTNPDSTITKPNSVDEEFERQLQQGAKTIQITINSNQGIVLANNTIKKWLESKKDLEINGLGVTLYINNDAVSIPPGVEWLINIKNLSDPETKIITAKVPQSTQVVGPVIEIISQFNHTTSMQFQKPMTVNMSYANRHLSGLVEDSLDVYYFNESSSTWEKMNGIVDKDKKTITFTTTHFSKYAIIANVSSQTSKTGSSSTEPPKTETPPPSPEPATTGAEKFTDLNGHWAAAEVGAAVKLGIASGMSPTRFAPDQNITRAQFATLLTRAIGLKNTASIQSRFNDVTADAWYFDAVNSAAEAGLVSGYSPTTFGPNDLITREQMAVMIRNALAYKNKQVNSSTSVLDKFTDRGQISSWALPGVSTAIDQGIITGRSATTIAPRHNATRAEGTAMILRMYKLL